MVTVAHVVVLAVVTIPDHCSWSDIEDYTLKLEKGLIEKNNKDKRLANKTTQPGGRVKKSPNAFIIYMAMAFTLEGKCQLAML